MFSRVASMAQLNNSSGRLHLKLNGRYISIIKDGTDLFCIDSTCYHAGGPLGLGDIEELNGEKCIICPWHFYKVALSNGSKLYQALEMNKDRKLVPSGWKRKEAAQRVHMIEERQDGIYVKLNSDGVYDSDEYGTSSLCGERCAAGDRGQANAGRDGRRSDVGGLPMRSGHVLNPPRVLHKLWYNAEVTVIDFESAHSLNLTLQSAELTEEMKTHIVSPDEATPKDAFSSMHLILRCIVNHQLVDRPYTQVNGMVTNSLDSLINLSVRVYPSGEMTQYMKTLKPGSQVKCSAPKFDSAEFLSGVSWDTIKHIVLIGGGSGVTPMLQIESNIRSASKAACKSVNLVVCNSDNSRLVGEKALSSVQSKVLLHVSKEDDQSADRLQQAIIQGGKICEQELRDNCIAVWCGPAGFNDLVAGVVSKLGVKYTKALEG